jgi:hypothetical protein
MACVRAPTLVQCAAGLAMTFICSPRSAGIFESMVHMGVSRRDWTPLPWWRTSSGMAAVIDSAPTSLTVSETRAPAGSAPLPRRGFLLLTPRLIQVPVLLFRSSEISSYEMNCI